MKKLLIVTVLLTLGFALVNAQVVDPKKVAKKQGTKRTNTKIEQGVDKGLDKLEEGIGRLFGKKKKKKKKNKTNSTDQVAETSNQSSESSNDTNNSTELEKKKPNVVWSRFDFVPGDVVIFEDGPNIMEENGEFPSRWDLAKGQIEIANVDGENVMMFIDGNPAIIPYLKNSKEDYLPEVFTVEFDLYRPANGNRFTVYLYDMKNQKNSGQEIEIGYKYVSVDNSDVKGEHPDLDHTWNKKGRWLHISIAYTKGKLKVYMDDARLINIPHYEANPTGICLQAYWAELAADKPFYVKNVRIAKGGVKYYDRVLQDGKIICNGIRFDVNKASLKPESMGPINKIYQLLKKQPNLNFSVEGHTDSDGDDTSNKRLSESRAKVVMEKLIQMGISSSRLSYAGFGESKPLDNNSTPEGKANNRRVEFVKTEGNTASLNASGNGENSVYDRIIASNIDKEFDKLSDEFYTPISGPNGIVNGKGTVFLFFTSEKNLGKMEILDVDKDNNYKLTIRYATYNRSGETVSESDHFEIEGTFAFDLDKGNASDVSRDDQDFILKRGSKTNSSFALGGENIAIRKHQ